MKMVLKTIVLAILFGHWLSGISAAQDMREATFLAETQKQELFEQAAREKAEAERLAAESRKAIIRDRTRLELAIRKLRESKQTLEKGIAALQEEREVLAEEENRVLDALAKTSQMVNELVGAVRGNAKDIAVLYSENLQAALNKDYPDFLSTLADESSFPGMEAIATLAEVLFDQIESTAQVSRVDGRIVDRNGKAAEAEILVLGPFCAAYRSGGEVGFLRYSPAGKNLYAVSKLPPKRMQKLIRRYMDGESDSVIMDIGRGAALQQLSHSMSLWEQVEEGRPDRLADPGDIDLWCADCGRTSCVSAA